MDKPREGRGWITAETEKTPGICETERERATATSEKPKHKEMCIKDKGRVRRREIEIIRTEEAIAAGRYEIAVIITFLCGWWKPRGLACDCIWVMMKTNGRAAERRG